MYTIDHVTGNCTKVTWRAQSCRTSCVLGGTNLAINFSCQGQMSRSHVTSLIRLTYVLTDIKIWPVVFKIRVIFLIENHTKIATKLV